MANLLAYNYRNPVCKDTKVISAELRDGHPLRLLGKTTAIFLVLALLGALLAGTTKSAGGSFLGPGIS